MMARGFLLSIRKPLCALLYRLLPLNPLEMMKRPVDSGLSRRHVCRGKEFEGTSNVGRGLTPSPTYRAFQCSRLFE